MKAFAQSCPALTFTNRRDQAAFVVAFERGAGKWLRLRKDNNLVVFDRSGDAIFATSTRKLGSAVRGFCRAARILTAERAAH
jgi:hypothetical protein